MATSYDGIQFYDDDSVFEAYRRRRERLENANDTLERPVMRELLGDVSGQHVLDLGCGNAMLGQELLAAGAGSYLGIDGSRNMVEQARRVLQGGGGRVEHQALEQWQAVPASATLVCASLVFHYLADLAAVLHQAHRALRPGGRLVFSVEHPVVTSCDNGWEGAGLRQDWVVDDYFNTGERSTHWLGAAVIKYHRTLEDHFLAVRNAGFTLDELRESRPLREHFSTEATFLRRQRIPLFLFLAARKA